MKTPLSLLLPILTLTLATPLTQAATYHVATNGLDSNAGSRRKPLRTIQHAANLAQPGDTITVHEGTYREYINPPRGGSSNRKRITYQAAPNATVVIKGSERISNWTHLTNDVWQATLPNTFFNYFNPYTNAIHGDWFNGRGRTHHTGAVYLNGTWLTEAASKDELFLPPGTKPDWITSSQSADYLLNVAWLQPAHAQSTRTPAASFSSQQGIQTAACSEGGQCIGWVNPGDSTTYPNVDFGNDTTSIELRVASASSGGLIQIHLNSTAGPLLGTAKVPHTGDWQNWTSVTAIITPLSGPQTLCLVYQDNQTTPRENPINPNLWFATVSETETTILAQFPHANPNTELVEINTRQTVFYPNQPGRNYITLRGFTLQHAATPWAPPTAEQIGLVGTHWSQGWIIENNTISHSTCSGIALGKHGDAYDNTSADTAEGYIKTIERAHAFPIPWTRNHIGHHIVRNNTISHCEQAGIVGSMGAAFSTIERNHIHDIHVRTLFTGAEMAGIKFHAAIDTTIRNNHIHHTCRGLWLDWMTQGTRVTQNLFHDNPGEDLFIEVNHGPFVVDNNVFLSPNSVLDMSEGAAFVHNLFAGRITNRPEPGRETPYHPAHSTTVAGLATTTGGDHRFYNNIFVGDGRTRTEQEKGDLTELRWISSHGLWGYNGRSFPLFTGGNVYCNGAEPYATESNPLILPHTNPINVTTHTPNPTLQLQLGPELQSAQTQLINSTTLGHARVPDLPYVNPDNSPLKFNRDTQDKRRNPSHPTPGPFEIPANSSALFIEL